MAKKDEEDVDDQDDGAEDAPPESILRHFPRRGPPSAAGLRDFKSKLRAVHDSYARLVSLKIGQDATGPESRKHVHQDVLTRFWALVKEYGVPPELGEALSAVAWGMLKNYRRRRERAAAHARASRARHDVHVGAAAPLSPPRHPCRKTTLTPVPRRTHVLSVIRPTGAGVRHPPGT